MDGLYAIMNIVGPLLLGAVLLYAILSNRKKNSPADLVETERGTKALHDELDREDKARENKAYSDDSIAISSQMDRGQGTAATGELSRPNISTEHQPEGGAQHPRDTLDREPKRDPLSQGSIPDNYNPATNPRTEDHPTAADAARAANRGRD